MKILLWSWSPTNTFSILLVKHNLNIIRIIKSTLPLLNMSSTITSVIKSGVTSWTIIGLFASVSSNVPFQVFLEPWDFGTKRTSKLGIINLYGFHLQDKCEDKFQFFRQIMLYSFLDLQEFKTQSPCSRSVIICSNLICGISLHFFCMCLTQLLLVLKLVLQVGQLNGFSPVWILIWVTISRLDFIAFGHIGQMYWLSTFKGTICICNESREERTSRIQIMIYSGMLQVKKALGVQFYTTIFLWINLRCLLQLLLEENLVGHSGHE